MNLKGLYGWAVAVALLGTAIAAALGPLPASPLSFLGGAAVMILPFATWHWMLAKRRPAWAYLLVGGGKLALIGWLFFGLNGPGRIHENAFLAGMAAVLVGAICFGIDASRGMIAADSKGAA